MKRLRSSKITTSWLFTFTVCLLLVGGAIAVVFWPRQYGSEIYQYYSNIKGIKASYFENYRINDTVFVDITLLEAVDSNGWNILCEDLFIVKLDSLSQKKVDNGKDLIFTKQLSINDLSKTNTSTFEDSVLRTVSYLRKEVSVFHTKNEKERHAVFYYNFDKTTKQ